jgi:23S rRNA pseudouridine1911/1915/1917 synthase
VHEVIPAALAGERIDRVVALVTGLSRVEATALVTAGEVVVNGRAITAKAHRLA